MGNASKGQDAGSTPTKRFQQTKRSVAVGPKYYKDPETSDAESDDGLLSLGSSEGSSSSGTKLKKPQFDGGEVKTTPKVAELHGQGPSNAKSVSPQGNKNKRRKHCKNKETKFFSCKICRKKFALKGNCQTHERTHAAGETPFGCKFCDLKFTQKGNCQTHERTHTGEKPFGCKFCDKTFTQKSNCQTHERKMHTGD